MTGTQNRRWSWYAQTLDAVLAIVGISIIIAMVVRWSFPVNGILLALACVGAIGSGQMIDALVGRWAKKQNGRDE